jgi:hypothetical protein
MGKRIIAIYCLCDDLLQTLHNTDDAQCYMSDREVMTTAITVVIFIRGNFEPGALI